jgi:hypothetical protein
VGYTATKEHSFQVGALIEYSIDLDYAIVRIVWENETELKPQAVKVVTQFLAENTLTYGLDSSASSLVAYGFPIDRAFEPTAAAGFAKIYWGESGVFARSLLFNVGVTNGNSGGPVFLTDSFIMVSLVRSGVRQYGAEGHNGNDPEFAGAWNSGPAMFEICKVSNILKAKGCIPRY